MAVRAVARPSSRVPRRVPTPLTTLLLAITILTSACSSKDSTNPLLSAPAKLVLVSGDGQSAIGPVKLGSPLTLKVTDPEDRPVAGVVLVWSTSDPLSNLTALTDTTDATGQVFNSWTLGPTPGRQSVKVTTSRIAGSSAVFQALNGVATVLATLSGDNQVGDVGATLASPLVVKLTDAAGNPSVGATVTWTATGGGTVTPATSQSDATGQATAQFRLSPTPGPQTVVASTSGPPATRTVFSASNGATISGNVIATGTQTWSFGTGGLAGSGEAISSFSGSSAMRATGVLARLAASVSASSATAKSQTLLDPSSPFSSRVETFHTIRSTRTTALSGTLTNSSANRSSALRRVIVQFKPEAAGLAVQIASNRAAVQRSMQVMQRSVAALRSAGMVELAEPSPIILATRVTVPSGTSLVDAMAALANDPSVESVSIDSIIPMLERYNAYPLQVSAGSNFGAFMGPTAFAVAGALPGPLPNNPLILPQLWHYNLVDAPRAWATTTGSANVLVAVVDDGIRFDHPALSGNLTSDGYNFVAGGNRLTAPEPVCTGGTTELPEAGPGPDPTAPDDLTDTGTCWSRATIGNHGMHVAGTIGAKGNSGIGTAGLNWAVSIRPVRVLDITGSGSNFDVAQGVLYAAGLPASNGAGTTVTAPSRAAIINMSLGSSSNSTTLRNAVVAATAAGTLIVAASGNSETNSPFYPAAYPDVVSVVALGPDVQLASYTNVGTTVSLSAPGGGQRYGATAGVASTTWDFTKTLPSYAYYEGTSMATPHVVGVAALVLALNPTFTAAQLRTRLQSTAVDLGPPGRDDRYGYGLVNAYNAVNNVTGPTRTTIARLVNATTGDTVRTVSVKADGGFAFTRLAAGNYFVTAGQMEASDLTLGVPRRAYGWFGPANAPTAITLAATQNASASVAIGTPIESEPNNTPAQANRMVVNSFVLGSLASGDTVDVYTVQIPKSGTYYFETGGVLGSCGYGLELDTVLTLSDATNVVLGRNDEATFPGSRFCSAITQTLAAGTYFIRVSGTVPNAFGQYRLWVRDQP